ncbi:STAS-like domain-containing protein [Actinobacillus suis]|uniref:STAS-like domain-containing protein n=1 Tax=Actinobacillus suis TaxID=716 RepID=UPI00345E5822
MPGPRYKHLGKSSGEEFREEELLPKLRQHGDWIINLDGVAGYGSSFLEEAFGGCVRAGIPDEIMRNLVNKMISDDDPDLITEIKGYVEEAIARKNNGN